MRFDHQRWYKGHEVARIMNISCRDARKFLRRNVHVFKRRLTHDAGVRQYEYKVRKTFSETIEQQG